MHLWTNSEGKGLYCSWFYLPEGKDRVAHKLLMTTVMVSVWPELVLTQRCLVKRRKCSLRLPGFKIIQIQSKNTKSHIKGYTIPGASV